MLEMNSQNSVFPAQKTETERKVNPLGKPNKRFLGRTINDALVHNKREKDRTVANCQRKLQDLDDFWERRRHNRFYNRSARRSRRPSSRRSRHHKKSKKRHRRAKKRTHSRSRDSSSSQSLHRSRSHKRKKSKKSTKKHRKLRRRSRSSSAATASPRGESLPVPRPSEEFLKHSKQMAMAVALAYGQVLNVKTKERGSSPLSDIVRELMSDDEEKDINQAKSPASPTDNHKEPITIAVSSSSSEDSSSSESSSPESDAESCIAVDISSDESKSNNTSDIEIIEITKPQAEKEKDGINEKSSFTSVDLTSD
ncbi:hypothetical protein KR018_003810 [Drosophila ironensis]|nr:hypothetical protein KR018_003810 [Drosophila ironensis]